MHHGIKVEIMGTALRFYKMGKLIMTATFNGRLGYLDGDMLAQDEVNTVHIAASKTLDLELWHCHFSHLGINVVKHGGWLGPHFRLTIPCHLQSLHPWETAQRLISEEGINQSITDPC